ncbi:MAG: hypothetical protein ABJB86_21395 [Bacteroidota bacterium]
MALQTTKKLYPPKKMSLEMFSVKLVHKIIDSPSPAVIERYIGVAVRALGNKKVNGYITQRFIDRVGLYLDTHIPTNKRQEENSQFAKMRLQQFRQQLAVPAITGGI